MLILRQNYQKTRSPLLATVLILLLGSWSCSPRSSDSATDDDSTDPSKKNSSDEENSFLTDRQQDPRPNVIFFVTDDHGFADVSAYGGSNEISTPHIDSIAENGILATNGYVTAPQCIPSRAALATGIYQERFGVDDNLYAPLPLELTTIGEHFQHLGYETGFVGKWHLEINDLSVEWYEDSFPNIQIDPSALPDVPTETRIRYFPNRRGFTDTFFGYTNTYWATFDLDQNTRAESYITNRDFRVDVISDAAEAFIDRHYEQPFFLQVSHFAPHVPLEAPDQLLSRFSAALPERRRYALAMITAVDEGIGKVLDTLKKYDIYDNTLIFFISDNGAPIGLEPSDTPINDTTNVWDGSLNSPQVGEKGMLTDGGIHIPYLIQWPNTIPAGTLIEEPVSSLDAIYTALKAAGAPDTVLSQLDGVDLAPAFEGESQYLSERPLFWRFWAQSAVRLGNWKYIQAGPDQEYLFQMSQPEIEVNNQITTYPETADALKALLESWKTETDRSHETTEMLPNENRFYLHHVLQIPQESSDN